MFEATVPLSIFGIAREQATQDTDIAKRSVSKPAVQIRGRNNKSIFVRAQAMINRQRLTTANDQSGKIYAG